MENRVLVFAGPNGSGKSTTIARFIKSGLMPDQFICPDVIVKQKPFNEIQDERSKYIAAMNYAEEIRLSLLDNGISFAFETVFSTRSKLDFLKLAKEKGFIVETVFITTEDPEINIKRVSERVSTGGHNVPKEKIIERYNKTMSLLPEIIEISDSIKVYDNSKSVPMLVFSKTLDANMVIEKEGQHLKWVQERIIKPLQDKGFKLAVNRESIILKLQAIHQRNIKDKTKSLEDRDR